MSVNHANMAAVCRGWIGMADTLNIRFTNCLYYKNKLVRLIALQYAARTCKQNKRCHTSARLTLAYKKTTSVHGTDGETDRQSATQYAAPS